MAGFNDFIQNELPLRPFVVTDGTAGQVLVRSTHMERPREMVWADFTAGGGETHDDIDYVAIYTGAKN